MFGLFRRAFLAAMQAAWVFIHNSLAVTGLLCAVVVAVVLANPDLRGKAEQLAYTYLSRGEPVAPKAAERAVAVELAALTPAQQRVAYWIATKYRLALEPTAALVAEAYRIGPEMRLSPTLILAVAAIESNFHPFIQSEAGAQGLMQVMPQVHKKRYEALGGAGAAFDPQLNMRVGASILRDFIRLHGGSEDAGLRGYLGGSEAAGDGGYVAKVRAEQQSLDRVAASAAGGSP